MKIRLLTITTVALLVGASCTPTGPLAPVKTSPATGHSAPIQFGGPGHSAEFIACGDAGDVVDATISGLSDRSYYFQIRIAHANGAPIQVFEEYLDGAGPTWTASFDPLPATECVRVFVQTGTYVPGDLPSPFSYLVTW